MRKSCMIVINQNSASVEMFFSLCGTSDTEHWALYQNSMVLRLRFDVTGVQRGMERSTLYQLLLFAILL